MHQDPHNGIQFHSGMDQRYTKPCTRCTIKKLGHRSTMLSEQDVHKNPEISIVDIKAMNSGDQENICIHDLRKYADTDEEYHQLKVYIINSLPNHFFQLPEGMKEYWNVRDQLTSDDNLIMYCSRLVDLIKV